MRLNNNNTRTMLTDLSINEKIRLNAYTLFGTGCIFYANIPKNTISEFIINGKTYDLFSPRTPLRYKVIFRGVLPFTFGVYGASFVYHVCTMVADPIVLAVKSVF